MLDLSASKNIIEIQDGNTGDIHEFYYRMPTNPERAAYMAQLWKRQGRKMVNNIQDTRVKFGLRIITGFKKGTMIYQDKVFSSDPNDADYLPDWIGLLASKRGDIIAAVAHAVFERTGTATDQTMFDDMEDVEAGDDDAPESTDLDI